MREGISQDPWTPKIEGLRKEGPEKKVETVMQRKVTEGKRE